MTKKCKPVPGFSDAGIKEAKIDASGSVPKVVKSQPITSGKNGKNGMPDSGIKPAKV